MTTDLDVLIAASDAIGCLAEPLHVSFPSERAPHEAALLRTLGVTWSVRPSLDTGRVAATAAHDIVRSRDCVEDSCTGDASDSPRRGPFANRCPDCREKVKARMRAGREAAGSSRPTAPTGIGSTPASPPAPEKPRSLTAATADLHRSAKGLEDKVARRRAATHAAKAALAEFNDALNVVKQTAERLLGS